MSQREEGVREKREKVEGKRKRWKKRGERRGEGEQEKKVLTSLSVRMALRRGSLIPDRKTDEGSVTENRQSKHADTKDLRAGFSPASKAPCL